MEESLELLPSRRKSTKHSQQIGKSCLLHTNLYEVNIRESPQLQQYVIETEPMIDDQAISLIRRLLIEKKDFLLKEVGLLTFKGKTLWGGKKASKVIHFKVEKNAELNILEDYEVLIKHTRSLSYAQIFTLPLKQRKQIFQVYTVILKQKIHKMGMNQTTRSRFLQHQSVDDIKGFKILMCYDIKLQLVQKKMNLLVDVGFRILSNLNALQELNDINSKDAKEAYAVGKSVVTTYNNRAYRVQKIRFDLKPSSVFFHETRGKNMTFFDYFKQYHKINIVTQNQFLLETTISYKNEQKGGKQVKVQKKGFLIPELCRFSASLLDIKQRNFHTFNDISKKIKIDPQARKNEEIRLITSLNNSPGALLVSDKCTEVEGVVYEDVVIMAKQKLGISAGNIKGLKEVREPMKMEDHNWLFVYSNTHKDPENDDFVDDTLKALIESGKYYGIKVSSPLKLSVDKPGVDSWIRRIGEELQNNPKLKTNIKTILLIFAQNEKSYYSELKQFITNTLKLPCQAILKKTMQSKNRLTICGKILLQINAKIGQALWTVPPKHPYWKDKTIMYGGLAVSKNLKQQKWKNIEENKSKRIDRQNRASHSLGFVGTYSEDLSKIYTNEMMVEDEKDLEKVETFEKLMIDWIKNFFIVQKSMPDVIMLYREGLTEKQMQNQGKAEVEALTKIVARAKTRVPNYNPQIVYIMVVKKASKRVYRPERTQSSGKFAPHTMKNPIPGTMVFEPISTENVFDFHLTAQSVTEGTTCLTQFQIAYDASEIPEDAIAQFTLEQCYNYPNWLGGIKVPSCLQSADKLSRLVGEHIHQEIVKEQSIQTKPFYL